MVNTERLFKTFTDLCRLPSPSGREGRVANYIRAQVSALGLTVVEDDAAIALDGQVGNLFVRYAGNQGEPLFFTAHMDTVPLPFEDEVPVIRDGDRVHTGGRSPLGGDDKAGVALALELLAGAVESAGQSCPLEVVFTVQEEQGARGAGHFEPQRLKARQGFVLDGDTPVGTAIRQAPHKYRFHVEVRGRKAHAAVEPEKGVNAIKALGAVIAALPTGRLDQDSVANLGYIAGGGVINAVPDEARLVGELRSLNPTRLPEVQRQIEKAVNRETARHGATGTVEWVNLYPGYFVPDDAPCARLFARACRVEGFNPAFCSTLGGGDANPLNNKGLTCIVFGLGMEAIHSNEEYILLSRLTEAARILRRMVGLPV